MPNDKKKKKIGKILPPTDLSLEDALKEALSDDSDESDKDKQD